MAKTNLYTCDICGELYEGGEFEIMTGTYSSHVTITDYGVYDSKPHDYVRYDLCPCCMTRVKNYMKSLVDAPKCGVTLCPFEPKKFKPSLFRRKTF